MRMAGACIIVELIETRGATMTTAELNATSGSGDATGLAPTTVPPLFTSGSESPSFFGAVISELAVLVPTAQVATIAGAGHIPHATHPDRRVGTPMAFHDTITTRSPGVPR
jgi:pimeloyl-ACP methyl ester carboxylesterase